MSNRLARIKYITPSCDPRRNSWDHWIGFTLHVHHILIGHLTPLKSSPESPIFQGNGGRSQQSCHLSYRLVDRVLRLRLLLICLFGSVLTHRYWYQTPSFRNSKHCLQVCPRSVQKCRTFVHRGPQSHSRTQNHRNLLWRSSAGGHSRFLRFFRFPD